MKNFFVSLILILSLAVGVSAQTGMATATMQNAAVASGNGTVLTTVGMGTAVLTVNCATCSGGTLINFEGTQDGTNYKALNASLLSAVSTGTSTSTSGITIWTMGVAGLKNIRARVSAYSAGTVTVTGTAIPLGGSGGSGGSGGGGAVTIADGADSGAGATTDARCTTYTAAACTLIAIGKNASYQESLVAAVAGTPTDARCTTYDTTSCGLDGVLKNVAYQLSLLAGGTATASATDPCFGLLTTPVDKYLASATPVVIASATSAKKNNFCSGIVLVQGTAETVSIIEGTGSNCGTGTAIVWGGDTTASHGFAFAANNGTAIIRFNGKTANVDTCLRTAGANPITFHGELLQQ